KRAGQFKDDVLFGKLGHPIPCAPPDVVVPIELDARPVNPERALLVGHIPSRLRPAVKSRAGEDGSHRARRATTAPVIALTIFRTMTTSRILSRDEPKTRSAGGPRLR